MSGLQFIKKNRCIDIVFCIDGTGSMSPCIESVKNNARRFYTDFAAAMTESGSEISMMRVKVIIFRDYKSDGQAAMEESRFFELPNEDAEFAAHLSGIRARGGCNEDANGLEALYFAMHSDFVTGKDDRQMIILFADTTAIPMGVRKDSPYYPRAMVDENGLLETWECTQKYPTKLRDRTKRIVFYAPAGSVYEKMSQTYNRSIFQAVKIHRGMDDVPFDDVIKLLAASASSV